jgi:ribosomal protein S18 acetylase RimI-like enzyme
LSHSTLGAGWIATVESAPAGYLLAVYVFSLEHLGVTAEIDEFFVSPSHRGSGIGAALLETAEAEFTRAGLTNVSLQLARNNDAARRFYHAHGYGNRSGYELLDKVLRGATGIG